MGIESVAYFTISDSTLFALQSWRPGAMSLCIQWILIALLCQVFQFGRTLDSRDVKDFPLKINLRRSVNPLWFPSLVSSSLPFPLCTHKVLSKLYCVSFVRVVYVLKNIVNRPFEVSLHRKQTINWASQLRTKLFID